MPSGRKTSADSRPATEDTVGRRLRTVPGRVDIPGREDRGTQRLLRRVTTAADRKAVRSRTVSPG